MRYGAALILGGEVKPVNQILIKFHSNLEQIGGKGDTVIIDIFYCI